MALSSAEIASIISIENVWMTTACDIYRVAQVADGMGGFTESWSVNETTVCDLWEGDSRQEEGSFSANQDLATTDFYITLPYDTDITAKDVVVINAVGYDVIFVPNDQSLNTALRCKATKRNNFNVTS